MPVWVCVLFKFQYGATNIYLKILITSNETTFKFQYGATNIQVLGVDYMAINNLNSNMELLISTLAA